MLLRLEKKPVDSSFLENIFRNYNIHINWWPTQQNGQLITIGTIFFTNYKIFVKETIVLQMKYFIL
jgi:hypothetical protein